MGEGLEVERETAGGLGERLRWAQSSPERGAGSPEATNTHTHRHRHISQHLIVKLCLDFSPCLSPYLPTLQIQILL